MAIADGASVAALALAGGGCQKTPCQNDFGPSPIHGT
jgi:hypothetical protein